MRQVRWLLPMLLMLPALVSCCGSNDPFAYVPVSGKITYENGSLIPAARLRLTFVPQGEAIDEKTHPRPGVAEVNVSDGTFDAVTSRRYGDGIVRGKHKVIVIALDAGEQPTDAVPAIYQSEDTTPLEVDTAEQPFALTIKKTLP